MFTIKITFFIVRLRLGIKHTTDCFIIYLLNYLFIKFLLSKRWFQEDKLISLKSLPDNELSAQNI